MSQRTRLTPQLLQRVMTAPPTVGNWCSTRWPAMVSPWCSARRSYSHRHNSLGSYGKGTTLSGVSRSPRDYWHTADESLSRRLARSTLPLAVFQAHACRKKAETLIGGSLFAAAELDLNVYYVLALNDNATLTVVDPRFGFGGTKLLALVDLPVLGRTRRSPPTRRDSLCPCPRPSRWPWSTTSWQVRAGSTLVHTQRAWRCNLTSTTYGSHTVRPEEMPRLRCCRYHDSQP